MALEIKANETKDNYNRCFYATICHVCKRFDGGVRLMLCGGCRMIVYCSELHRKQHWKRHKSLCKAIRNVLPDQNIEDRGVTLEESNKMKVKFMQLVTLKIGHRLEKYEKEMFLFPRECVVCHERYSQLLEDCKKCAAVSFCKNHKDDIKHRDVCAALELSLRLDLLIMSEKSNFSDLPNLQHVSNTDTFQDMNEFIKIYGNIQNHSEMSYNILAVQYSLSLTFPLTLFYAMEVIHYVPGRKNLVIHAIVTNAKLFTNATLMACEVLLHLIETVTAVVIILIGPKLEHEYYPLPVFCEKCQSEEKKCYLEFHDVSYETYVRSPLFVIPDLVVGFNACISKQELTSASSIQVLGKQNCPLILTCCTRQELEDNIDRMTTILVNEADYIRSGKNPYASLRPYRMLEPERVFYDNRYIIIYESFVHNNWCA